MYWARLQRLPYQEENQPDHRTELDNELGVREWKITERSAIYRERADVDPDAPSWWQGDEEASESFMRSMGLS